MKAPSHEDSRVKTPKSGSSRGVKTLESETPKSEDSREWRLVSEDFRECSL